MTTLPRRVLAHATERLTTRTLYQRRRLGILTYPLGDDWLGWLGLNTASYAGGKCDLNPVVGVRHAPTERIVADLQGLKYHQYLPASYCQNVGYVGQDPDYKVWTFTADGDWSSTTDDLIDAVAGRGVIFQRGIAELRTLGECLRMRRIAFHSEFRRLAILLQLQEFAALRELASVRLKEVGDASDIASTQFRVFCQRILELADGP